MAATQIKKEESQAVGVYQLKNGFWAYRFIVKINGEQKTQRRSKDEEGNPFRTQKQVQRIRIGLTQEQLAEAMCVPKSTISAYENDKVDIKSSVVIELSKHLFTSPNYLHGYKEEQKQDPYAVSAAAIFRSIKDEQVKALLLGQIQLAGKMGM